MELRLGLDDTLRGGLRFLRTTVGLTPEESSGIEDTTIAVFRELSAEPDAFFHRVTRAMERLETALHEWNADGAYDDSLARIRAAVLMICATIPAGDQSRTNSEAFLSSLESDASL